MSALWNLVKPRLVTKKIHLIRQSRALSSERGRNTNGGEDGSVRNVFKDDVLSRTKIVVDAEESGDIIRRLLRTGEPVAVDMEGIQLKTLGLLQVKAADGTIYLFRTGRNPKLLDAGGLRELLEHPDVVKVMHASSGDCQAVYKHGIKLWNLYDTAVAHKVIHYQNSGASLAESPTIGFNQLCDVYGFAHVANPLKTAFKGQLWKRENAFADHEVLDEDLIFYAACDVEPLLDIHDVTDTLILPDFRPLFQSLCERELLRCIDSDLYRYLLAKRHMMESCNLFIYGFGRGVSKADVHLTLAKFDGGKKVFFNDDMGCCHVIMPTRQKALLVHQVLSGDLEKGPFGPDVQLKMVKEIKLSEISSSEIEAQKHEDRLKKESFITDPEVSKQLMDIIAKVRCPVVIDFSTMDNMVMMEMFVGKNPPMKYEISPRMIQEGGLGQLFTNPDVVKIVPRLDASGVIMTLKACQTDNFKPRNFFDIMVAFKMVDYMEAGQSIYKTTIPRMPELLRSLGIYAPSKVERLLYAYVHFQNLLPAFIQNYLAARARVEIDITTGVSEAGAKESRKQLKSKYETYCVHIRRKDGGKITSSELKEYLSEYEHHRLDFALEYRVAFVEMVHHADKRYLIEKLNNSEKYLVSNIDLKSLDHHGVSKTVNVVDLDRSLSHYMEDLTALGFFDILEKHMRSINEEPDGGMIKEQLLKDSFSRLTTVKDMYSS